MERREKAIVDFNARAMAACSSLARFWTVLPIAPTFKSLSVTLELAEARRTYPSLDARG